MQAERYQVVQTRFAAIRPVLYVLSVDKSGVRAARVELCGIGGLLRGARPRGGLVRARPTREGVAGRAPLLQVGQLGQRMGYAYFLAGRVHANTAFEIEPMRAGEQALLSPILFLIEFVNQRQ